MADQDNEQNNRLQQSVEKLRRAVESQSAVGQSALSNLFSLMKSGGGDIKTLTSATNKLLPEFSGLLSPLGLVKSGFAETAGYLQDVANSFRSLSKTGQGLGGSLTDLLRISGQAGLGLEEFTRISKNNSEAVAGLAVTLERDGKSIFKTGVEAFSEISRTLITDSDLINKFVGLGMSVDEASEFVLRNTQLQRRSSRFESMSIQESIEQSLALAKNMQIMAKLTGKNVDEMYDEISARQRDGKTTASLMLLEKQNVKGAQEAFAGTISALGDGPSVLKDLFQDYLTPAAVPMTEATEQFAAINQESSRLAKEAADFYKRGEFDKARELLQKSSAASQEFAQSERGLFLATLSDVSEFGKQQADVLKELKPVIDQIDARVRQLNGSLTYSETLQQYIRDADESFQSQMNLGPQTEAGGLRLIGAVEVEFRRMYTEFQQQLAERLDTTDLSNLSEQLEGQGAEMTKSLLQPMLDLIVPGGENQDPRIILEEMKKAGTYSKEQIKMLEDLVTSYETASEQGTVADKLDASAKLQEFLKGNNIKVEVTKLLGKEQWSDYAASGGYQPGPRIENFDTNMEEMPGLMDRIYEKHFKNLMSSIFGELGIEKRELGGPVTKNQPYVVGEKQAELFVPNEDGDIVPNFKEMTIPTEQILPRVESPIDVPIDVMPKVESPIDVPIDVMPRMQDKINLNLSADNFITTLKEQINLDIPIGMSQTIQNQNIPFNEINQDNNKFSFNDNEMMYELSSLKSNFDRLPAFSSKITETYKENENNLKEINSNLIKLTDKLDNIINNTTKPLETETYTVANNENTINKELIENLQKAFGDLIEINRRTMENSRQHLIIAKDSTSGI